MHEQEMLQPPAPGDGDASAEPTPAFAAHKGLSEADLSALEAHVYMEKWHQDLIIEMNKVIQAGKVTGISTPRRTGKVIYDDIVDAYGRWFDGPKNTEEDRAVYRKLLVQGMTPKAAMETMMIMGLDFDPSRDKGPSTRNKTKKELPFYLKNRRF